METKSLSKSIFSIHFNRPDGIRGVGFGFIGPEQENHHSPNGASPCKASNGGQQKLLRLGLQICLLKVPAGRKPGNENQKPEREL